MENPDLAKITVPYDQFHIYSVVAWIEANGYDPFVTVRTDYPGVTLPPQQLAKSHATLNLASRSMHQARWTDTGVEAMMRFNGQPFKIYIPYRAMVVLNFRGTGNAVVTMWAVPDPIHGVTVPLPETPSKPAPTLNKVEHVSEGPTADTIGAVAQEIPAPELTGRKVGHLRIIK